MTRHLMDNTNHGHKKAAWTPGSIPNRAKLQILEFTALLLDDQKRCIVELPLLVVDRWADGR